MLQFYSTNQSIGWDMTISILIISEEKSGIQGNKHVQADDMTDGATIKCTVTCNLALNFVTADDGQVPLCATARSPIDGPVAVLQFAGYCFKDLHCCIS